MTLPDSLAEQLERRTGLTVTASEPLGGGSINRAVRLTTDRGELFLKWNDRTPPLMFTREREGLERLRKAGTGFRIPKILAADDGSGESPGFLLMEYIPASRGSREASARFGTELAALHRLHENEFGLEEDNYIGRLPQSNRRHTSWTRFFISERIEPQLRMAVDSGRIDGGAAAGWEALAAKLNDFFPEIRPSLLHGDLWSGNYFFDPDNHPVLVDPAVYFGHPEMELAFTRMFGGFSDPFYDAYATESPLAPGFSERVPVYNLYPLLVHVNLFGGHYAVEASRFLKRYR